MSDHDTARTPPADGAESVEARLERLEQEREFLLVHSRNLERQLYRLTRQRDRDRAAARAAQTRTLEARLGEITSAHVAVLNSRTWRAFAPYRALRGWVQQRLHR
jgi:hypothetical protein